MTDVLADEILAMSAPWLTKSSGMELTAWLACATELSELLCGNLCPHGMMWTASCKHGCFDAPYQRARWGTVRARPAGEVLDHLRVLVGVWRSRCSGGSAYQIIKREVLTQCIAAVEKLIASHEYMVFQDGELVGGTVFEALHKRAVERAIERADLGPLPQVHRCAGCRGQGKTTMTLSQVDACAILGPGPWEVRCMQCGGTGVSLRAGAEPLPMAVVEDALAGRIAPP